MKTKSSLILIPLLFLFLNFKTSALIFNEIMYDPDGADTDREWVELLNESNDTVDLASWKFFEANTNHGLSSFQGGLTVPIGGYAIIASNPARFLQDNPTYSGTIIKASFSLSNSGEYLAMKNSSGAIQDSLTYIPSLGGQDDGTTLSFIGGTWLRGDKTPGGANTISTQNIAPPTPNQSVTPVNNNSQPLTLSPAISYGSDISVNTVNEKIVLAGADAEFTAHATLSGKKAPEDASYSWSFGDGGTRSGRSVGYHYQYPGTYLAMVEVTAEGGVATSRTKVKVIAPEVSISDVGGEIGKNYVEILNSSSYDVDVSNWKIAINKTYYPLPRNTIIMGKQKVRFAGSALGFGSTTLNGGIVIQLMYPNHDEMFRYISSTTKDVLIKEPILSYIKNPLPISTNTVYKKKVESMKSTTTQELNLSQNKRETGVKSWIKRFLSKL